MSASNISSNFSTNSEDSTLVISCVSSNENTVNFELTEVIETAISTSSRLPVSKHTNLDSKPLTLYEQIHLIRIYYLTVPNVIRCFTILICIILFGYILYSILTNYYRRNIVVVIDYNTPNTSVSPAFSFCTECVLCYNSSNFSIPRIFYTTDILENDMVLATLNENGVERFTDNPNVPSFDVLIDCFYFNDMVSSSKLKGINCLELTKIIVSVQGGSKCWTLFSNIHGKENENLKMLFDYMPLFNFRVRGQWFYEKTTNVYFSVHNPDRMPGMDDSRYHVLAPGKYIDFRFSKEVWNYKEVPNTKLQCFNYRKGNLNFTSKLPEEYDKNVFVSSNALVTADKTPIYRSSIECFQYCMWRKLYNTTTSTINLWADFTLDMTQQFHFLRAIELVAKESQKWKDHNAKFDDSNYWIKFGPFSLEAYREYTEKKKECIQMCPHSCIINNFPEAVVQITDYYEKSAAYISVQWAVKTTNVITYKDDRNLGEIIGEICGLHVFLKLSAVTVVIYIVNIIKLRQISLIFRCCLINWFQRKRHFESMDNLNI